MNSLLLYLNREITYAINQAYRYRVIILGLAAFNLLIWFLDQGQDLLGNSMDNLGGLIFLVLTILGWAFINWYLAKLFFPGIPPLPLYPLAEPVISADLEKSEKKISRLLGTITLLLPNAAILHIMKVAGVFQPGPWDWLLQRPLLWLFLWAAVFYLMIKFEWIEKGYALLKGKSARLVTFVLLFLLVVVALVFLFPKEQAIRQQPAFLINLNIYLVVLAFAFYIFVTLRTSLFSDRSWINKQPGSFVLVLIIIPGILFIGLNVDPLFFVHRNVSSITLPLIICGSATYVFVFTMFARLSHYFKINVSLIVIVLGLIVGIAFPSDYHQVRLMTRPAEPQLTTQEYFRAWLLHRRQEILDTAIKEYPVFLINTYGGGIRAAAFTSFVLSYLDAQGIALSGRHKAFEHYVFSISGASGGTIGASILCAYRQAHKDSAGSYSLDPLLDFYKHDFLTSVVVPDLGRDVWASQIHFSWWSDRAAIQEETWSYLAQKYLQLNLDRPYEDYWLSDNSTEVPLLFSNTLNVDDGLKGIYAPVKLSHEDFPGDILVRDHLKDTQGPSLITGAFMSARFPFVSPTAALPDSGYHFMDGGGQDNSGAATSENIFLSLARYIQMMPKDDSAYLLVKKIHFYFISIANNVHNQIDPRSLIKNQFDLTSPLIGIVQSGIDGNGHEADSALSCRYGTGYMDIQTSYLSIAPDSNQLKGANGRYYTQILPLGWEISEPALKVLRSAVTDSTKRCGNDIGGILKIIH